MKETALLPKNGWPVTRREESEMQRLGLPGWLGAARAERSARNLGDPSWWVEPNAPGDRQAATAEVGGARSSEEAG